MAFDVYIQTPTSLGSFLSSRYQNSSIQKITMSIDLTGSAVVLIER